jgi:hypothetical protein
MGNNKSIPDDSHSNKVDDQVYSVIINAVQEMSPEKVNNVLKHYQGHLNSDILVVLLNNINQYTNSESLKKVFKSLVIYNDKIIDKVICNNENIKKSVKSLGNFNFYFVINASEYRIMEDCVNIKNKSFIDILSEIKKLLSKYVWSYVSLADSGKTMVCSDPYSCSGVNADYFLKVRAPHKTNILNCINVLIEETEKCIIERTKQKTSTDKISLPQPSAPLPPKYEKDEVNNVIKN